MAHEFVGVLSEWVSVLAANSVLAGIVFAVVLIVTRPTPLRSPVVRVALWSLIMVRLVLPPDLGLPFAAGALVERVVRHDFETTSPAGLMGHEASVVPGDPAEAIRHQVGALVEPWRAAAYLWLSGFMVVAVVQLWRRRVVRRVLGGARPAVDPEVLAACEDWRRRLDVRRRVRVVTSAGGLTPFTTGVVRPLIYLPQAVIGDFRCMEVAIAHEMAHVARFDALWLGLQHVLQTVYFFNPVVWITGALINEAREQLCDATVVAADRLAARDYVGGLLEVLRLELRGVGASTMTARKRRIGVRILTIFEREGAPRPRIGAALIVAAVVGLFLLPLGGSDADALPAPASVAVEEPVPVPPAGESPEHANPLLDGRITWGWGPGHLDPFTHKEVSHRGIDLAAPAGTPVVSPAEGVVVVATASYEASPASGTVILIDHGNGLETFYAHLGSIAVAEGQKVGKGVVIAAVGSTGKSTGPHLHFEVRRDGEAVDPAEFVTGWN